MVGAQKILVGQMNKQNLWMRPPRAHSKNQQSRGAWERRRKKEGAEKPFADSNTIMFVEFFLCINLNDPIVPRLSLTSCEGSNFSEEGEI